MNNGISGHVGIPRPTRSRVIMAWWQVSWLADCHLYTTFPGNGFPVALMAETRRLQLRGQPRHCVSKHTHRVPSWPFRGPPSIIVAPVLTERQGSCRAAGGHLVRCVFRTPHRPAALTLRAKDDMVKEDVADCAERR